MKQLLTAILLTAMFFLLNTSVSAQNRAECDACGYCVGRTPPGNWEACRACVYPGASTDVTSNQTLQLNKLSSGKLEPVHKAEGKYFTQLGCLDVGENSFSDPSAPGGVLNFLLTKLIFPIVGALAFISLIYGAFILMTAQDRPEQVGKGKSYIVGAIVGLIFTLSAILIINILAGDILKIPGFSRTPQAAVVVRASTATINGEKNYPILGVSFNGKEIETKTLAEGNQNIDINVPISATDLSNPDILKTITFTMKNDECYSTTNKDRALCCDCAQEESAILADFRTSWRTNCSTRPISSTKRAQCLDKQNYNGDVNMYISNITINGKRCLTYEKNGSPIQPVIGISSTGANVYCTSIEN